MHLFYQDLLSVYGTKIEYKPGTKTPISAGQSLPKYEHLEARINKKEKKISLIIPDDSLQILNDDFLYDEKIEIIDGKEFHRKYSIKEKREIKDYPFKILSIDYEEIPE